jgi:hypothetical protein
MTTIADGSSSQPTKSLACIDAKLAQQPQPSSQPTKNLSLVERAEYDRIWERLRRAKANHRRAEKHGDAKKLAAAERAIARAEQAREAFVQPRVGHLWAPGRIIGRFESRWSGPGVTGAHIQECEMVLDHKDISGPQYETVRVLKDEGGPPTNVRSAPTLMGVAWFAVKEQIASGKIVALDEEEPS